MKCNPGWTINKELGVESIGIILGQASELKVRLCTIVSYLLLFYKCNAIPVLKAQFILNVSKYILSKYFM